MGNEASFGAIRPTVDTRFDLVHPTRSNALFVNGKKHNGPCGVYVDGIHFFLHSTLPLGVGTGLFEHDDVNLIFGEENNSARMCNLNVSCEVLEA